jgi:hypothetical protein
MKPITHHWTITKTVCNPILRLLGYSIISIITNEGEFKGYKIRKYPKYCAIKQKQELSTEDRYNTIKNIYEIGHRLQDKLQQMMQIKLTISNDSILKNQEYLQRYLTQLKAKKRVDTNILTIIDKIDGTEEDYVVTETFRKSNAVLYNPVYKVRLLEYTIKGGMKMLKMLQSDNKYAVEQLCSTIMRKHKGVQANMKKVAPRQAFSSINIIFFIINCIGKMFGLSCNWN